VLNVRRADVLGVLSVGTDLAMNLPPDVGLRSAALAVSLARAAGLDAAECRSAFDVALLQFSGCVGDTHIAIEAFGNEMELRTWLPFADFGKPSDILRLVLKNHAADQPLMRRAGRILRALSRMSAIPETTRTHCELARLFARALGFGAEIEPLLDQIFERWDGKGVPNGVKGDAIARSVRVVALAHDVVLFLRARGREAALEIAKQRSGGAYDPEIVGVFLQHADQLLAVASHPAAWEAMLGAEPDPIVKYDREQALVALGAVADFADMKSRFTAGHSRAVADLASRAAAIAGLPTDAASDLVCAALVHDIGGVGITAMIWDKPGPLDDGEWEAVRLHAYQTERCLARARSLSEIAKLAGSHHERLDQSGYPKATAARDISRPSRLLAAADVYQALLEPRAHRPAFSTAQASDLLVKEAKATRLDPLLVDAVLSASGQSHKRAVQAPALSDREIEVLRLVAQGLTNKEVANALDISAKTVGHHLEHIYDKLGASTRAGATVIAVRSGLL
jgi:HD-GYP domain-containing protein (c-di-GMP phosphodiesterase class II)